MSTEQLFGIGVMVFLALVGVIWKMMRDERTATVEALEKKASNHALAEYKIHVKELLEQRDKDIQSRMQEHGLRQDREIGWLKDEINRINEGVSEIRRDVSSGNSQILTSLSNLATQIHNPR